MPAAKINPQPSSLPTHYTLRDNVAMFSKTSPQGDITLAFIFEHSRSRHEFNASELTLACIKHFNGRYSNEQIAQTLDLTQEEVDELAASLLQQNIIEIASPNPINARYARQLNFFSSFENQTTSRFDYQQSIEQAKVVIVGVGSIGTWLSESLVRCGVGHISLIDNDVVELSNLPRQALFSQQDVGRKKIDAAAQRLKQLNDAVNIDTIDLLMRSGDDLTPHIKQATVVVNCTDQPDVTATNTMVSDACFSLNIPHVLCGGYDGHLSFVGQTIIPHHTACWQCYLSSGLYEKQIDGFDYVAVTPSQVQGGTLAPVSAISANIHALEVIRVISQYCPPGMQNRKAELDFLSYTLQFSDIARQPDCPLCGSL